MAPTIKPMNTFGVKTSTVVIAARLTKAPKRARDTRAAEPIAKPCEKRNRKQLSGTIHFLTSL